MSKTEENLKENYRNSHEREDYWNFLASYMNKEESVNFLKVIQSTLEMEDSEKKILPFK